MAAEEQEQQQTAHEAPTSTLMEVSKAMIGLYKNHFGRGPTKTRSYWAGPDAITCVLEDTLTPAERNLARMGAHERLRDARTYFQYASVREFCEPVERITGRTVRSFHSSTDTKVDGLSVETFIFYADGQTGPSRIDLAGPDEV
jgi:uncharacterized protein YbcI